MDRALGGLALGILGFWLVIHLMLMGRTDDTAETTAMFALGLVTGAVGVAAIAILPVGLALGGPSPALLKVADGARTAAAVLGCTLIIVGLVHYRSTEPHGEIHWVVLGMVVLLGSGVVHWWLGRVKR